MKFRFNEERNKIEMINEISGGVEYQYDIQSHQITTNNSILYLDELKMLIEEIEAYEMFIEKKKRIDEQIGDLFDE